MILKQMDYFFSCTLLKLDPYYNTIHFLRSFIEVIVYLKMSTIANINFIAMYCISVQLTGLSTWKTIPVSFGVVSQVIKHTKITKRNLKTLPLPTLLQTCSREEKKQTKTCVAFPFSVKHIYRENPS